MCPGCCPGIGMGVTPNGHCGTLFQKRAYSNPTRTFEFPRTKNRTVETARLVYKSNRNAI
jgi:hypothetical protein